MCAKSKSGGTRTFIRGRVGSDVYSVGRDAKGKKQQVVRSLAESVANPQTQSQMRGRMIMSTIAQALAVLRPIVDHSFDGLVGARANLAEFVSRNYALIKADVANAPSGGNSFGLVKYQEKGAKQGAYVVSNGAAVLPAALVITHSEGKLAITLPADNVTVGGLKAVLGMSLDEYFTFLGIKADGTALYERFRVSPDLADDTAIAAGNIADVFATEGNAAAAVALDSNVISITLAAIADCCGVIISKKSNGGYIHNRCVLGNGRNFVYTADLALPTYPVGAQNYLNGGDIFGMSETNAESAGDVPVVNPTRTLSYTISGAGSAILKDASENVIQSGAAVEPGTQLTLTITPAAQGTPSASLNGSSLTLTTSGANKVVTFAMPDQNSTMTVNTGTNPGGQDAPGEGD